MISLQSRLARKAQSKQPSPIRELMRYLSIEDMISLGGGYPNPETFMLQQIELTFKESTHFTFAEKDLIQASQYAPSDVLPALKTPLFEWQKFKDDVKLNDGQLVVLNGSQEGIFIMAYLFLDEDDFVVVSEPSYPGAIAAIKSFTKNFLAVPLDSEGMQTDVLIMLLAERQSRGLKLPKFIYTIPTGHNPGGVTLSLARRKAMIEIAQKFDLLILEDDPYQLLQLEKTNLLPTLQSLDQEGRVIRLDSFSKIFAPGLRLGYASGSLEIIQQFIYFKQSSNIHTSSLVQKLLGEYLQKTGFVNFMSQIQQNCLLYQQNRDAMIAAAQRHLPPVVKFNSPAAGMFIWFELPTLCDATRMIEQSAADLKVVLVPGTAFSTQQGLKNYMRASFSMVSPSQIEEGIRRFALMIQHELNHQNY
ncbi:PLP-dependent aminotransferase family protein [candidate division KSB1 bacterium]|nr:PLP-dependent aminotransferase family protein [candidate division KSB1 bacterium]